MVGGIFTAIQQDASEVEEKAVKELMDHYTKKMLLHAIKIVRWIKKARCNKTTSDKQNLKSTVIIT